MTEQELKDQQMQLVLQRSQAKDVVEQAEIQLGQIAVALKALEAAASSSETSQPE